MKYLSNILLGIVLIATTILFIRMHKVCNKIETLETAPTTLDSNIIFSSSETGTTNGKFAYIDVQRINSEYEFYKEVADQFEAKQKRAEAEYMRKAQKFQSEYEEYMTKAQRGAFLSQASQQQQEADLMQKQENLKKLEQDLSIKLQNEMQNLDFQVKDTVMHYLDKFNKEAGYIMILNSVSILDAGQTTNITDTILSILNSNYKLQNKKETK